MAFDVRGNNDYRLHKVAYTADDFVSFSFTATEDYYVVGLLAYISDTQMPDVLDGWSLFRHDEPASPIFLAWLLGATLEAEVPSFEAKFIRIYATQDCWIRFDGPSRVQHFIPKTTWVEFRRICNKIYLVRDAVDGSAYISFYG